MSSNSASANIERVALIIYRFLATGRVKALTRLSYLRLLGRIDRIFLVSLRRFGASTSPELAEAARRAGLIATAGWPCDRTAEDWLTVARRRGLVEPFAGDDRGERWALTAEGRERARGWLRHIGPALRTIGAVVAGLSPLLIGGALFSGLGDVDWDGIVRSTAFEVIAVVLYFVLLFAYLFFMARSVTIVPLGAIELTRKLEQTPRLEIGRPTVTEP